MHMEGKPWKRTGSACCTLLRQVDRGRSKKEMGRSRKEEQSEVREREKEQ